ncbi:MAG: PKD domain-containing protein, partial [Bacteroidia bacterium]
EITLYVYMDCENGSPEALRIDTVASIGIFRNSDYTLMQQFTVDTLRTDEIKEINYNCLEPPTDVCVTRYSYSFKTKLIDVFGGYTVAFQRCCRNYSIVNVFNQNETGGTYFTTIPERKAFGDNSSPRFEGLPPNFLCVNSPFEFKHLATDPDGDSLVYELCLPYAGGSTFDPIPRPPVEPPYSNIVLNTGFSVNNFLNASPSLQIKKQTGLLTCTPKRTGQFVVGICVKEYRNNVLLSTVVRDFQLNVIRCNFDVVSSFTLPEQQCDYEVTFNNLSQGAVAYKWNFGDPTTKADTSDKSTVKYTYPKAGWYDVKLIAYSTSCSDTFIKKFYVKPDTGAFAGPDVRSCNGESVVLGPDVFFPNSKYKWSPPDFLSNDTAKNPLANPPNDKVYLLKQTFDYCFGYDTVTVINGPPDIDFDFEPLPECKDLTYQFKTTGEGRTFNWNFGTGRQKDVSTLQDLYFTFPKNGTYNVKYVAALNPSCKDSIITEILVVADTNNIAGNNDFLCFGDSLQIGTVPPIAGLRYNWIPANYLSENDVAQPFAKPEKTTTYTLVRTANQCEITDSITITVDRPEPFFKLAY